SASLLVTAPLLKAVSVLTTSVTGGLPAGAQVSLASAAPAGGFTVSLASSDPSVATVPASVTVPAGKGMALFTVSTSAVAADKSVTITGDPGGVNKSASLLVKSAGVRAVTLYPTSVSGGMKGTGAVYLTGPAPSGGWMVPLTSSDPSIATVPGSVTVAAGNSSVGFTITTSPQASDTSVTITADPGGANKTASLPVKARALASLSFSPTSLKGGASTRLCAVLTGAAPAGGTSVSLSATAAPGENGGALNLPPSVMVPAGSKSVTV